MQCQPCQHQHQHSLLLPLVFFPLPRKENRRKETKRQFPPSSSMPSPSTITNSLPNTTTNWSQKVGNYITRKGNSSSSSKNLDLTEESLEEFNRRNEMLFDRKISSNNNNKTTGYSPYSRGLTDSSLALHRQRLSSATSPERESNASTSISSGSKSSFIVKIQEWGSNFVSASKEAKSARPVGTRLSQHTRTLSSSSTSSSLTTKTALTTLAKELGLEAQIVTVGLKGKKPLRERDSENPQPPPVSPLLLPPVPLPLFAQPSPPPAYPPQAAHFFGRQTAPSQPRFQQFAQTSEQPPPSPPPTPLQTQPPPPPPPLRTPQPPPLSPPSPPLQTPQPPPLSPPPPQAQASFPESTYVWADRYRPEALKDFICNRDKALELKALAKKEDCGHFIFEGPPGVGKKTMIWALLRESYGEDKVQTKEELKKFVLKGEVVSSIKVSVKISPQHVEVNLSEVKGYEKHVIVELMQETINRLAKKALQCNKDNCRVIILYEADKLSADALLYIKWQLGRHKGCSKVFFCCSDASKLQPIMSLCTVVKLLPPSNEEIVKVLEFIAKQEGIELPHQLADKIAFNAKNNLRQAIRSLEATWQANSALTEDQEIMIGWEGDIANIAKNIVEEQSPKQLYVIRGKLQNLIEHNVCPSFIIDALVRELKKCSADEFQEQIDSLYDEYKKTARKRDEDSLKRHKDPVKKNLHHFMRIEGKKTINTNDEHVFCFRFDNLLQDEMKQSFEC